MFPFFVLYHLMLSGNFYNSEIRHGIFWVLFEALGIFLGFKFCPHSIIPVTWNPEYSPPPPELCVLLIQEGANVFVPKVPRVGDNLIKTGFSIAYLFFTCVGTDGCEQGNPSLYFIDDHNIKCVEFQSLRQSNPNITTVVSNIAEGTAIDIDVRNNIVYWSDTHAWTINKKNLTSGEVKVILKEDIGEVFSIAVEWESGLIYWTDYLYERIEVAKTDGSARKTLVTHNVKSPVGIAVHPGKG